MTYPSYAPPAYAPDRRNRSLVIVLVIMIVGIFVIAGVTGYVLWDKRAQPITISGSLVLPSNGFDAPSNIECMGKDGYDDIREGAAVVIHDAAGKVMATGELKHGKPSEFSDMDGVLTEAVPQKCTFAFTVHDVPAGQKFYGVEVSHRGTVNYSATQVKSAVSLSLG
jgi:hypothetical protein